MQFLFLKHSILIFCSSMLIGLSSCAPSSDDSTSSPVTNNPPPPTSYTSPVQPAHLSATFNGVAAQITTEVTVTETSAAITITGIENIEGASANSGMLSITAAGYTLDKTTLTIPNPAGTDATNVIIGDIIVTANDQAVTHRVTVNFLALSGVRLTITDANLESSLTLTDTERTSPTGITIKQCEHFELQPAISILAGGNPVNANQITLDPQLISDVYYDRTTASRNTNNQRVSVTVAGNSYEFMFPIIVQECTAAGLTQIADSSLTPNAMAWNIDNDLRLNLVAELVNKANSEHADDNYIVTENIDLGLTDAPWSKEASTTAGTKGFRPIGTTISQTSLIASGHDHRFKGNFNCDGHIISNLYISNTGDRGTTDNGAFEGLFGVVDGGTISNCGLLKPEVTGVTGVGALVGSLQPNSMISHSFAAAVDIEGFKINTFGVGTGGLVGINAGTIAASYVTGTVTVDVSISIGGIAGTSSTITNSYAIVTIETSTGSVQLGGLVGSHNVNGSISQSYAAGNLIIPSGTGQVGGLIGRNIQATISTDSYWDRETTGQTRGFGGKGADTNPDPISDMNGKTSAELKIAKTATSIYSSWDSAVWNFTAGQYPRLINVPCANWQHEDLSVTVPVCSSTLQ